MPMGTAHSEAGELHGLVEAGVASISTSATPSTFVDPNGNEHRLVGALHSVGLERRAIRPTCGSG